MRRRPTPEERAEALAYAFVSALLALGFLLGLAAAGFADRRFGP